MQAVLVRLGFDRLAQAHHFGVRVERRGGFDRRRRLPRRRRGFDAVVREEFAQLRFRQRAGEAVDQLPVLDQHHRRDRADLERGGELLLLVDVDLGQQERAVVVGRELFQDRAELLARPAPVRPEIDEHRHLQRLLQHPCSKLSAVASKMKALVVVLSVIGLAGFKGSHWLWRFGSAGKGKFDAPAR